MRKPAAVALLFGAGNDAIVVVGDASRIQNPLETIGTLEVVKPAQ